MGRGPGRPRKGEERDAMDEARQPDRNPSGRRKRVPLGVQQQRLGARVPDGMVGRWVNDTPGRIDRARQAGYEFINEDGRTAAERESCRSEIVGTAREGGPLRAYLMAIPRQFYEEDQAAKQEPLDRFEEDLRRGHAPQQAAPQDRGKFYQPDEGASIRQD